MDIIGRIIYLKKEFCLFKRVHSVFLTLDLDVRATFCAACVEEVDLSLQFSSKTSWNGLKSLWIKTIFYKKHSFKVRIASNKGVFVKVLTCRVRELILLQRDIIYIRAGTVCFSVILQDILHSLFQSIIVVTCSNGSPGEE